MSNVTSTPPTSNTTSVDVSLPVTMHAIVRNPTAFEISRPDNAHMAKTLAIMVQAAHKRLAAAEWLTSLPVKADTNALHHELAHFADASDQRTWEQLADDCIARCPALTSTQAQQIRALLLRDALAQRQQAQQEHAGLVAAYRSANVNVEYLPDHPGPDAVFTTDTGEQLADCFLVGRLMHTRRQGEEQDALALLKRYGIPAVRLPHHTLEGGDLIYSPFYRTLFVGEGFRNRNHPSQTVAARFPELTVVPVQLTHPEHYHLDCCFNVLSQGEVIAYREAIAPSSWSTVKQAIGLSSRSGFPPILWISRAEALKFGTNFVCVHRDIFLPAHSLNTDHIKQLHQWGYRTHPVPFDAFHRSGGSVRCSTLILRTKK